MVDFEVEASVYSRINILGMAVDSLPFVLFLPHKWLQRRIGLAIVDRSWIKRDVSTGARSLCS